MEMEANSNTTDLRVASFSCYLKPHDDKLSVFGFDKFSGMETGYQGVFPEKAPLDQNKIKPNVLTARTSSINSAQAKHSGKAFGKWLLHGFLCTSPCSTKKAVYVNEMGTKGVQFAFPVLNPNMDISTAKEKQSEQAPSKSLEVFGSGTMNKEDMMKNLERKMSILNWDAIPKADGDIVPTTNDDTAICDDMASEASSELFEIENISKTGSFTSCTMSPSMQYTPIEASIELSIITASTIEFSSIYPDNDEKKTVHTTSTSKTTAINKTRLSKKAQKNRLAGFLGCKSHQSVKVAEPVYKTTHKPKHQSHQ